MNYDPSSSLPQEIIRTKREGRSLGAAEIQAFVAGIADGGIGGEQMAAFAMAVCINGMNRAECTALTRAMTHSGRVLEWREDDLPGPLLDKHSTGGVGDKVSLVLAPLLAACGACVPTVSGRGLGHTGGTLDKLDAIPGYRTQVELDLLQRVVRETGCAIVGATEALAPADRRLYAVRDVTGTVESVALITASILSKKLAAGIDALVLDVKAGSGAFTPSVEKARTLAESMVAVAADAGLRARALVTDMGQVLGRCAGNALEVAEAIQVLRGENADPRLLEVVMALGAEALRLGALARDEAGARVALGEALASGRAAERFQAMVCALGGPRDLVERPDAHLPAAPVTMPVIPAAGGMLHAMDVRALGLVVVGLGGGRTRREVAIDPSVGLSEVASPGEHVGPDRPAALVHARDESSGRRAVEEVLSAISVGDSASTVERRPAVLDRLWEIS